MPMAPGAIPKLSGRGMNRDAHSRSPSLKNLILLLGARSANQENTKTVTSVAETDVIGGCVGTRNKKISPIMTRKSKDSPPPFFCKALCHTKLFLSGDIFFCPVVDRFHGRTQ
ncbi:hypothetical protein TNCT_708751 [Trichonephila clavata]|uniref:Uncharacterized protein n=1 Tax=Trichonephila clavata TaxID=2740835 RepID=A0A8X6GPN5_TRICU|nr:hypothetical protein TNCT_708751 [Trichonephila clavata]